MTVLQIQPILGVRPNPLLNRQAGLIIQFHNRLRRRHIIIIISFELHRILISFSQPECFGDRLPLVRP